MMRAAEMAFSAPCERHSRTGRARAHRVDRRRHSAEHGQRGHGIYVEHRFTIHVRVLSQQPSRRGVIYASLMRVSESEHMRDSHL
jgi:hypothetical protein